MTSETVEANALDALQHYPLGAPVVVGRNGEGFINDDWIVLDKATGQKYALRGNRRAYDAERITFELSFQEHLRASDFPTAPVVRTKNGALFASVSGLFWSLSDFVEGQPFDFASLAQAREAGRCLARFEAIAADFAGPVVDPPPIEVATWLTPVSSYLRRTSMLTDQHEERLRERYPGAEHAADITFFSAWRRNVAQTWPLDRLAALREAWLHCDYHGRNMVFKGDELAGLFDFDFVGRGARTYDVGRGIFNFGREHRGSTTLREEFCRVFLEGFEAEAPLAEEERRSLPFMAVLNWVPDAAIDAWPTEEPSDADDASRLQFAVRMMRVVDAEMRRLAPGFGWGDA